MFPGGHEEQAGTLTYLLEGAREIARRLDVEAREERAAGRRLPGWGVMAAREALVPAREALVAEAARA